MYYDLAADTWGPEEKRAIQEVVQSGCFTSQGVLPPHLLPLRKPCRFVEQCHKRGQDPDLQ